MRISPCTAVAKNTTTDMDKISTTIARFAEGMMTDAC